MNLPQKLLFKKDPLSHDFYWDLDNWIQRFVVESITPCLMISNVFYIPFLVYSQFVTKLDKYQTYPNKHG